MSDIDERRIAGLVVTIDRNLCVGFGDCVDFAPEAFELDGDDIAVFRPDPIDLDADRLAEACRSCPVDALTAFDRDGQQIAP